MKFAIAVLLAPFLGSSLLAQEGRKAPELQVPEVTRVTEVERLFRAYGVTHGGRQALKDIKTVSFRLIPVYLSEEGEVEGEPVKVDAQLTGVDRVMRLDEEVDGQKVVKIANGMEEASVWINGEKRDIPDRIVHAQQESQIFYLLLDLLYKPESEDLKVEFGSEKERDGRMFYTAEYQFHPSRKLANTYRVFYDKNDGLVRRIDVHDTGTRGNIRINTMRLSEYAPTAAAVAKAEADVVVAVAEAKQKLEAAETPEDQEAAKLLLARAEVPERTPLFPGRIEILNRDYETVIIWRMVDVEMNAEFEPGHFSEP